MTDAILNKLRHVYWNWLSRRADDGDPGHMLSPHPWMDAIARNLPGDTQAPIYVDGGAYDGTMARRFLTRFPSLEVHAFEPIAETFARLEQNLAGVPGQRYPMALAQESGEVVLNFNKAPGTSSVLPRGPYSARYFNHATTPIAQRRVRSTSLDDWFDQAGLDRVDILKLDLQGFEGRVLRGAARLLDRGVACIFLEVMFVPEYEGCTLFGDVDAFLREHGYRLFNLYNLATHSDWQLSSGDALYVRDRPLPNVSAKAA